MCRNILLYTSVIFWCSVLTAQNPVDDYYTIRKEYAHFPENDAKALPTIGLSIRLAKTRQNFKHLFYAYEDAALYSLDPADKLKYADSCLSTAQKTNDPVLISTSHLGKGIVYYFNFRKFDKALAQYLLAAQSAEKTDNDYLKHKIKYNIGIVKSYLGYYDEALLYFQECLDFFGNNLKSHPLPAVRFNNTRGYLNTIHQMSICERPLNGWEKVSHLLLLTEPYRSMPAFSQEKGYFLKENGILAFRNGAYRQATDSLLAAAQLLQHRKEESHLAVTFFYLAQVYLKKNDLSSSIKYLRKVDSLFSRNEAVLPEVRKTYELLLFNKQFTLSPLENAHYTNQLLKANRILQRDLPYLSSLIYRNYDTKNLVADKEKLIVAKKNRNTIISIAIFLLASLLFFLYKINQTRKQNFRRYHDLLHQYETAPTHSPIIAVITSPNRKSLYSPKIIADLLEKLEEFEKTNGFISKDLTLGSLAIQLQTNTTHLSYVINEHKKITWPMYLKTLRIHYITNLMLSTPIYLNYESGVLGEMCGFKSRQQFAKQFFEIHQLTPSEFIKLRSKKE